MYPYNKSLSGSSRSLRRNMTPEEKHLWYDFLKEFPITVKRQQVIESYIVDFYIAKPKIVIELDGSQHSLPKNKKDDEIRDKKLSEYGITVLRFTNEEIKNCFESVCDRIVDMVQLKLGGGVEGL